MRKILFLVFCFISINVFGQKGAQATKDFLLGKTVFENDTNFVEISSKYTPLKSYNAYIQKETYKAFIQMYQAAIKDGIVLKITSASRNFYVQRYIWERKWKNSKISNGAQRAKSILKYNAMPGTSRHHWGSDIDLMSPKLEYWNSAHGKIVYKWLKENAHKFGFYQPYVSKEESKKYSRRGGYEEEKWHWSYMPLSEVYLKEYKEKISPQDLCGFLGDKFVKEINIIEDYVFGIAQPK